MEPILRDVRLALRRLRLAPGFTVFAVVSLALGIGVSTAVYSAVRTLFWMPLGVADQEALVAVTSGKATPAMSWPDFVDFRAAQSSFAVLGTSRSFHVALVAGTTAEAVSGEAVSGDYFAAMGVLPRAGRMLQPADEAGASRVAVLSERFWRSRLQSDPGVVGRTIKLGGQSFEVIGISRGGFHGLERFSEESVWIPITAIPATPAFGGASDLTDRRAWWLNVWGRLRPGLSAARAASDAGLIGQRLDADFPRGPHLTRSFGVRPRAAQAAYTEATNTIAGMILTAVLMVLLIACSNLANLALAKGTSRAQETAVRSALGASRWRLVREQLIEGGIVTAVGAALGALVLYLLTDYFTTDLPVGRSLSMPFRPVIDATVLVASGVAATVSLLVFTLWPALQSTREDLRTPLGSGASATPTKWRLHRNLVAWQVCGSVGMLLLAAMTAQVTGGLGRAPSGSATRQLAIAQIDFGLNGRNEEQARRLVNAALAAVRAQPGIEIVSASNGLPYRFGLFGGRSAITLAAPGAPVNPQDASVPAYALPASPEIFKTLTMRLARGRAFTDRDDSAAPPVIIVSEHLARQLFRATDVVGRAVMVGRSRRLPGTGAVPQAMEIVGVLADMPVGQPGSGPDPVAFRPFAQAYEPSVPVSILARSSDPGGAVATLRSAIRRLDPEIVLSAAGKGSTLLDPYFFLRVIVGLSTSLGVLALVLAMAGLFGVLSHVVVRRTREIGIRIAIGAERSQIFRLILRDGLYPVIKGLALGIGIGIAARLAVRAWVVTNASAFDPWVVAIVPIPFLVAALVACYLPAARASRVDPNVALRDL
jgi:putative ABC transport system permease protein